MHNKNYIDITKKWLGEKSTNNSIKIYDIGDTFTFRCNKYKLDGKLVKYSLNNNEYEFAKWLSNKTNKKIHLVPKINIPENIQTPDYKIGNEYWDLKTLSANNNSNQPIFHIIQNKNKQACNFIVDASLSKHSINDLLKEIDNIIRDNKLTWINKIAVKKDNDFCVIKKIKQ